MINDTPLDLYAIKIAENAWEKLVNEMDLPELKAVDKGLCTLNEEIMSKIIRYLKGTTKTFSLDNAIPNDEEKVTSARNLMQKHLSASPFKQKAIKGDSYFVKTSDDNTFEIGYIRFNLMSILHELGHAFLDMHRVQVGEVLWNNNLQLQSETTVNAFSRAFAMPRERFLKKVAQYSTRDSCDISSVANSFGVEYIYAYIRGKELHLWD